MTHRVRKMLEILMQYEKAISIKLVAEKLEISKRTAQRELDYMGHIVEKFGMKLCSKTGVGIWLEGDEKSRELLREELQEEQEDFADRKLRQKRLILELLKDQTPKKLYYFANMLNVSETTIANDLEKVQSFFDIYGISIQKRPGLGIYLEGKESSFRNAIERFFLDSSFAEGVESAYREDDFFSYLESIKKEYSILDEEVLRRVHLCLSSIGLIREKQLTQDSFTKLLIHLSIVMERIEKSELLGLESDCATDFIYDDDYHLASQIITSLEAEFGNEISDVELMYVLLHLRASKSQKPSVEKLSADLYEIGRELIQAYDPRFATILCSDKDFLDGFVAHLNPTIVRLQNEMPIENPHLDEIKTEHRAVYEKCLLVAKRLESLCGFPVPETEIAYLAVHFGAAMVRIEAQSEQKRCVRIAVVCASGIGISRLMVSKLQKYLKHRGSFSTYGGADLTEAVVKQVDFIISSIPLEEMDKEVLYVNPLLPEADMNKIEQIVSKYEITPLVQEENLEFMEQLDQIHKVSALVKQTVDSFDCFFLDGEWDFPQLVEGIAKKISPFVKNQRLLMDDIMAREKIASQMITELEIGLLHSLTKAVGKPSFYVVKPKDAEQFGHSYLGAVKALLVLLLPDDENKEINRGLLGYLSEQLIEDEAFLICIKREDKDKIKEMVVKKLKGYFHQFLDQV